MIENNNKDANFSELSFIKIINRIILKRKVVLCYILLSIIVGILYSFITPVQYRAEAQILPEVKKSSINGAAELLSQVSGMDGFTMPQDGKDDISPMLYPDILKSTPFFIELLQIKIKVKSYNGFDEIYFYQYMDKYYNQTFFQVLKKYTVQLPWTLNNLFVKKNEFSNNAITSYKEKNFLEIPKKSFEVIKILRKLINADIDKKKGIISVSSEFRDPYVAAQIADFELKYLTNYISQYRSEKAKFDFDFIKRRYQEKEKEYLEFQLELAQFKDANKNVILSSAQVKEQRLQNQVNLAFNVYNGLAQQLEQARIKVQEVTPVFKILEPIQVPIEKSKPQRTLIIIVFILMGTIIGVTIVLWKDIIIIVKELFARD